MLFFHIVLNNLMIIFCLFNFKETDDACMLVNTGFFFVTPYWALLSGA